MARTTTEAIVCGVRAHGEHGAVARFLTPALGLRAAYVRGARGRRLSPILLAGNRVQLQLSARSDTQLPQAEVELGHSRALLMREPLPALAVEWATALVAFTVPEGQPHAQLFDSLDALLDAIEASLAASSWASSLVRFELLILAELGFGLDPDNSDSPTDLPNFLRLGGHGSWREISHALALSGDLLRRHLLADAPPGLIDARQRLAARLAQLDERD